jgi:hypothetical protein
MLRAPHTFGTLDATTCASIGLRMNQFSMNLRIQSGIMNSGIGGARRRIVVAKGEKRSANRTQWTRGDETNSAVAGISVLDYPDATPSAAPADASELVWTTASDIKPIFDKIDRIVASNTKKVLKAFRDNRIGPHHFQGSTGVSAHAFIAV